MIVATAILVGVGAGCGWAVGTSLGWRLGVFRVLLSASLIPAIVYTANTKGMVEGSVGRPMAVSEWWSVIQTTVMAVGIVWLAAIWLVRRWWSVGLTVPVMAAIIIWVIFIPRVGVAVGHFMGWYDNVATVWLFTYSLAVMAFLVGYGVAGHARNERPPPEPAA